MENQIITYNQYGLGQALADTGFGRFFGRLFGRVRNSVLMAIPIVAAIVSLGELILNADVDDIFPRFVDDTLTPKEQTILDSWDNNLFTPFFKTLLQETKTIFSVGINLDEQLLRANNVLAKICAVKQHFNTTSAPFLSTNALKVRSDYVRESLNVIDLYIFQQFKDKDFQTTTVAGNSSEYDFNGLISKTSNTTFNCLAYSRKATTVNNPIIAQDIVHDAVIIDDISTPNKKSNNTLLIVSIISLALIITVKVFSKNKK